MNPQQPIPGTPRYKNPFIQMGAKRNFFRAHYKKIFLSAIIVVVVILIFCISIIRGKENNISTALFSGNKRIHDDQLLIELNSIVRGNQWFGLIPKKNIYLVDKESIESRFMQEFGFKKVEIDTISKSKTIHVRILETPITYKVKIGDMYTYASSDGILLEEIPENDTTTLFTISLKETPKMVTNERKQCDKELIQAIEQIIRIDNGVQLFDITGASLDQDVSSDVTLTTNQGWDILIDRSKSLERQLGAAQTIFNEKIKGTEKEDTLQYIDVRIEDRAFYK